MVIRTENSDNSQASSPFLKKVFLWGGGTTALRIAEGLCRRSIPVTVFDGDKDPDRESNSTGSAEKEEIRRVQGQRVLRIDGQVGHFRILIEQKGGGVQVCEAGCVLINGTSPANAWDVREIAGFPLPESHALSLVELEKLAGTGEEGDVPDTIGLWLDPLEGLPDRALANRAFRAVRSLSNKGKGCFYVLFRHIPLWGLAGQSLYDDLRKAGVRFLRIGDEAPAFKSVNGKLELEVQDSIVNGRHVTLALDRLLLIGKPLPSPGTDRVADIVGDKLDPEGFLQKDNVHLYPTSSFRKGIYYLGPCKGEQAEEETDGEVEAILTELLQPLFAGSMDAPEGIRIEKGHCVSCLTCYRVCPHHALDISQGPVPVPVHAACYECGLCATLCPGNAIELVSRPKGAVLAEVDAVGGDRQDIGHTVVFACTRSGWQASQAAREQGLEGLTDLDFIEVPCACSISEEMLLAAFLAGAEKVLVVGCHQDNCVSQRGTAMGEQRTRRVLQYLTATGRMEDNGLQFLSVASNEPHRLVRLLKSLREEPLGSNGHADSDCLQGEAT